MPKRSFRSFRPRVSVVLISLSRRNINNNKPASSRETNPSATFSSQVKADWHGRNLTLAECLCVPLGKRRRPWIWAQRWLSLSMRSEL